MVARAARENGRRVFAVALEGETDPSLETCTDDLIWIRVGQLERIIQYFKDMAVPEAIMAGGLTKENVMATFEPDERALALLARVPNLNDDVFLRALAEEFENAGVSILPSTQFAPELLAPAGVMTREEPTADQWKDIRLGWKTAKALGELDIGQCVVVKGGAVLAVEAIEGTDETIRRGGRLGRRDAVVVKVSKPSQDLRFDLPTVGAETVAVMAEVKASVLAVEAGKTLILDREDMILAAERCGITVLALEG